LIQTLVQGRYENVTIRNSLNDSPYFVKQDELPLWRKITSFSTLEDDVVNEAVAAMQRQFVERSITDIGEMLHIFSLQMMMAKHSILENSVEAIEEECKAYINDLLLSGRLPILDEPGAFEFIARGDGALGHGFWIENDYEDAFRRVVSHLRQQLKTALENTYPNAAQNILKLMTRDSQQFASTISYSGQGSHKYARLPVLKTVEPRAFVDAWLSAPKESNSWYWIKVAIEQRYEGAALTNNAEGDLGWLNSETDWLKAVVRELRTRADAAKGFAKYRIERAIPQITFPEDRR